MNATNDFYDSLSARALAGEALTDRECRDMLVSTGIDFFSLIHAAFRVRKAHWGTEVLLHIIDNVQNGLCSEDCGYCAQSCRSHVPIETYPMKRDDEILAEARAAYESGAWRHCIVFSGRATPYPNIERIARLVREIKAHWPMQVCVSPGLIDAASLKILKEAGVDRINHNLNTSQRYYPHICTTHRYQDRLDMIKLARDCGLEICSGIIVGMGEEPDDIVAVARQLRDATVSSIPVNFFIPIKGTAFEGIDYLTPQYCLRVLCLFRLLNPAAEIRIAAGREYHLRDLAVLALYPANSLFIDGYLNTRGAPRMQVLRMITDAGFTIKSDRPLDELIAAASTGDDYFPVEADAIILKEARELHPSRKNH